MRGTRWLVISLTAVAATACSTGATPQPHRTVATTAPVPVEQTAMHKQTACEALFLAGLTPRRKLAQLLTVGVRNGADALQAVRTEQIGGIFVGSWTDQAMLTGPGLKTATAAAQVPLMVTIDEEGGRVSRVRNLIGRIPSARQLARTMTAEQVYQQTLARARKLKALGVTVDFAPDADVSAQPDDAVIGDRSYSADPQAVVRYADAVSRGLRDGGVGAVLKHFPGHGASTGDSHKGAVSVPSLKQLQHRDLVPFRRLADSGAAVMVGHLDVPGLTAPGVPASLSPQVMSLLRDGVGYQAPPLRGPIFTDDLSGMAAITNRMGIAQAVETALAAGADNALWISTAELHRVLDRLEQALGAGRLNSQRVDASVIRMARYKGVLTC